MTFCNMHLGDPSFACFELCFDAPALPCLAAERCFCFCCFVRGNIAQFTLFPACDLLMTVLRAVLWQALRLFPAMVIVPTMQISWTLFSILSGGVFFEEYLAFTRLSAAMFVMGVVVSPFIHLLHHPSSCHESRVHQGSCNHQDSPCQGPSAEDAEPCPGQCL